MTLTSTVMFLLAFIYSIALPVALLIWWRRRTGEKLRSFLVGAVCFILFAMVLEQIPHTIFLMGDNAVSGALNASPLAYTLYAALAAGLFEETGRLFGFKVLLKKRREKACAVAYGIGHGGIEMILILGVTYATYLLALCGVSFGSDAVTESVVQAANAIPAGTVGIAMFERLAAMMAHIGLSMLVFLAARRKGKLWLYPLAILLHAALDAPAALYQIGVITSLWVVELTAFIMGLAWLLIGGKLLTSQEI